MDTQAKEPRGTAGRDRKGSSREPPSPRAGGGAGGEGVLLTAPSRLRSPSSFPDDSRFLETHQGTPLPQRLTSRCKPTLNSGIPRHSTSFVQNTLDVSIRVKAVHFAEVEKNRIGRGLKGIRRKGPVEMWSQSSGEPRSWQGQGELVSPVSGGP